MEQSDLNPLFGQVQYICSTTEDKLYGTLLMSVKVPNPTRQRKISWGLFKEYLVIILG